MWDTKSFEKKTLHRRGTLDVKFTLVSMGPQFLHTFFPWNKHTIWKYALHFPTRSYFSGFKLPWNKKPKKLGCRHRKGFWGLRNCCFIVFITEQNYYNLISLWNCVISIIFHWESFLKQSAPSITRFHKLYYWNKKCLKCYYRSVYVIEIPVWKTLT